MLEFQQSIRRQWYSKYLVRLVFSRFHSFFMICFVFLVQTWCELNKVMTDGAVSSFKAVLLIKECVFFEDHPIPLSMWFQLCKTCLSPALDYSRQTKPGTWWRMQDEWFGLKVHLFASGHSSYIKENSFCWLAFGKFWWKANNYRLIICVSICFDEIVYIII